MTFSFADFPSILVHARAAYPSWSPNEHRWYDQDYDANFFTKAIKADRAKMGTRVKDLPIGNGGARVRVSATQVGAAQNAFAAWAASKLTELDLIGCTLLAVPNSSGIVGAADFNIASITRAIAAATGGRCTASSALRFVEYRPKSEREHRPSVRELKDNMVLVEAVPPGPIVLIDDVFTQGHHLSAAAAMLPNDRQPAHAIVASRTVKHPVQDVWAPITEEHYTF